MPRVPACSSERSNQDENKGHISEAGTTFANPTTYLLHPRQWRNVYLFFPTWICDVLKVNMGNISWAEQKSSRKMTTQKPDQIIFFSPQVEITTQLWTSRNTPALRLTTATFTLLKQKLSYSHCGTHQAQWWRTYSEHTSLTSRRSWEQLHTYIYVPHLKGLKNKD